MMKEAGATLPFVEMSFLEPLLQKESYRSAQVADVYYRAWHRLGLCDTPEEALAKVSRFHPQNTWIAQGPDGQLLGAVHSTTVHSPNISDLYQQIPTYEAVESLASGKKVHHSGSGMRICFSIAVPDPLRVTIEKESGKSITVAQALLNSIKHTSNQRVLAYSRVSGADGKPLLEHIKAGFADSRLLGPVGMHEYLGGITLAVFENSRPEDIDGGGANVLVAHPRSKIEATVFAEFKDMRLNNRLSMQSLDISGRRVWTWPDVEATIMIGDMMPHKV